LSKSTITYRRKSDGAKVEVLMEPEGWRGWKKIYGPGSSVREQGYRIPDRQFFREYELPKDGLFKSFFKGIIR
jgi:hypothetical protein